MKPPIYKEDITVIDLLEAGLCFTGVCEAIVNQRKIIKTKTETVNHYSEVVKASNGDYGYGSSGYGDGDGDSGYGDGDGDGDGCGYGYGDGCGYGYGGYKL